ARVACCCGSDEKCAQARELGADLAIDYKSEDIGARLREFAPGGIDVFWETRRQPELEFAIESLAERGRLVLMAGRDAVVPFPVGPFYFKQCSVVGFVMFQCTPDEQRTCADDLNRWLDQGAIRPRIDRIIPLAEAAAAHQVQEDNTIDGAGTLAGKIVLTP
ncbi:MAG: zinc-binding dehydrogenase, partial [Verrucomicrobiales bacterium]